MKILQRDNKLSFQATISSELVKELNNLNSRTRYKNRNVLRKQIRRVASWGNPETYLSIEHSKSGKTLQATNLFSSSVKKSVCLGKDILKTFFELTEDSIKLVESKIRLAKPKRQRISNIK